jgi:hypothetical protein
MAAPQMAMQPAAVVGRRPRGAGVLCVWRSSCPPTACCPSATPYRCCVLLLLLLNLWSRGRVLLRPPTRSRVAKQRLHTTLAPLVTRAGAEWSAFQTLRACCLTRVTTALDQPNVGWAIEISHHHHECVTH